MEIAPIEQLVLPPAMDGHQGVHRRPADYRQIDADTDLQAILLWLKTSAKSPATFSRYRGAVNQLVNWTIFELGKPISSLDEDDFPRFCAFLRNPSPHSKWIGSRAQYGAPGWRPFRGPLSLRSQANTLHVLRALIEYLDRNGYCRIWRSIRDATNPKVEMGRWTTNISKTRDDPISEKHRQGLEALLQADEIPGTRWGQLALQLMYYCYLGPSALMKISINDFGDTDGWPTLRLLDKKQERLIYLAPPIIRSLALLRDTGELPAQQGHRQATGEGRLFRQSSFTLQENARKLLKELESGDTSSRLSRISLTLSDIKRAGQLYAGEHCQQMWPLIGYTPAVLEYVGAYLPKRKPLTFAQVSKLYRQMGFEIAVDQKELAGDAHTVRYQPSADRPDMCHQHELF